jgi:hypothetical protein
MDKKTSLEFIKYIILVYISAMFGWFIYSDGHSLFSCIHHTQFNDWWECTMGHIFSVTILPMVFAGIIVHLFTKSDKN